MRNQEQPEDKEKNHRNRGYNNRNNHFRGNRDQRDDRQHDHSRSRDNHYNDHRNSSSASYHNHKKDNWKHHSQRHNQYDQRQPNTSIKVFKVDVDLPKSFIIGQNVTYFDAALNKFTNHIVISGQPPNKKQTRLGELKNQITPIEKLWTSHIKQFLNDSEFVEIYRKGKSLAYGEIEYGKSIIKYADSDRKEMFYENQTSQSNIFSRAYFKLWEILQLGVLECKKNEVINIGCVAEGPGGFIHGLIDYRHKMNHQLTDTYYAITLRIDQNTRNAKDWSDYRGKTHFDAMRMLGYKIRLSYGQTKTGNLLLQDNIDFFAEHDLEGKKCYLVTGDGGIQCIGDKEFQYQEVFNCKLFFGEILTALKIQEIGGTFILKIYDCSFELTKQLLILLTVFYQKVRIVKPITSRPGNSQKYLLCQKYIGISPEEENELKQLLKKWTEIEPQLSYFQNKEFVQNVLKFDNLKNYEEIYENIEQSNKYFLNQQEMKLEEGLLLSQRFNHDAEKINEKLKESRFKEQLSYAYAWCKKYRITTIEVVEETEGQKDREETLKEE